MRTRAQGAGGARRRAFGMLALANVLWAGTYTAGKVALAELSPFELNAVRFILASALLAPVLARNWRRIPFDRRTLFTLLQLTLLGFVLNKAFEYVGLALSTASDVALLIATESVFTALLSWLFLRERITRTGVAALALGLVGVYLIVERGVAPRLCDAGASCAGGLGARVGGDLLVVLSLLLESGYTVKGKTALANLPPLLFTTLTITGSLAFWLPAGALAVARGGWPHVSAGVWLAVLYMAAVATVAGYTLWFRALTTLDASAAAPTLFIQPLLGALLAVALLHETLSWATLLGGGLIGLSLVFVMLGERRAGRVSAAAAELAESVP